MSKTTKLIGIVIIILILIGLGIYYFSRKQTTYFNRIELEKNTYVLNRSSLNFLDTIVYVGLDEMKIFPQTVLIRDLNKDKIDALDPDLTFDGYIVKGENEQYIMYISDKLSRQRCIEVVSHELIHLHQYYSGRLKATTEYAIWENEFYPIANMPEYTLRPWEQEAFELDSDLSLRITKKLYSQ